MSLCQTHNMFFPHRQLCHGRMCRKIEGCVMNIVKLIGGHQYLESMVRVEYRPVTDQEVVQFKSMFNQVEYDFTAKGVNDSATCHFKPQLDGHWVNRRFAIWRPSRLMGTNELYEELKSFGFRQANSIEFMAFVKARLSSIQGVIFTQEAPQLGVPYVSVKENGCRILGSSHYINFRSAKEDWRCGEGSGCSPKDQFLGVFLE